jgi:hypothetical protein
VHFEAEVAAPAPAYSHQHEAGPLAVGRTASTGQQGLAQHGRVEVHPLCDRKCPQQHGDVEPCEPAGRPNTEGSRAAPRPAPEDEKGQRVRHLRAAVA